ncbi:hypothetical protein ACQ4PT_033012 [Festuca glaucescens]
MDAEATALVGGGQGQPVVMPTHTLAIAFPIKTQQPQNLVFLFNSYTKIYSGKKFTMNCRMTSAISLLVVALLFSSLRTASARHVVTLKDIRGHVAGDDARKAPDPVVVNAGGSRPLRTVETRGATKHHHRDAAAEMNTMLRRDYAYRASRRKPIHNDEPLEYEP